MTLSELTARAQQIRERYAALETQRTGQPWTRAELAQGFAGDVGELMKLVMAKEGRRASRHADIDNALAHELADCLWSVLVLAKAYNVDLERTFLRTMDELERRIADAPAAPATKPRRTKTARTSRARRD
ncbi:MAG TPA: MazG nucleotide pyrophosphohydrolase domain-containing protein [Opitutus sp.]|nr:MazG nucleotide pyrophosphohydrolase domain-containing protein [Opitutus sp.]